MTDIRDDVPTEAPAKPRRKAWWIVGGSLTGAVLLLAVAAAGGLLWAFSSPRESDSRTETYESVTGVELDVGLGEVNLTASDGAELQVERDMTWKGPEPHVTEELRAGVFEARSRCSEEYMIWMLGNQCRVDYSIGVPSGAATEVRTELADIDVEGLDGDLSLVSALGDIDARHLRTTGTSIETSTGGITVAFDEVLGDVDISTGNGDVTVLVPDDGTTYDVRFETSVGEEDIRIATDPTAEADYVITMTSGVGDLEIRYLP